MQKWLDNSVIYQIYPTSFYDSNGDGIGDFNGIKEKLGYLKELGVDTIWLSGFCKSNFKDAGYDVIDYYDVDSRFGTLEDCEKLIAECKKQNIKFIMDLVIGHTSDQCPWFLQSSKQERNKYSDYYIWTDSLMHGDDSDDGFIANPVERDGCYRVNYYVCQPALNYGYDDPQPDKPWQWHYTDERLNPLHEEIINIMRFWKKRGVDGFRCDLAQSLIKKAKSVEPLAWLWKKLIGAIKKEYPDTVFLAEWGNPHYSVESCGFDLDYLMHEIPEYNALFRNENGSNLFRYLEKGDNYFSPNGKGDVLPFLAYTKQINETVEGKGAYVLPSGYHDIPRLALYKDRELLKVIFCFLLTYKSVPLIYYGDEIGITHQFGLHRDGGSLRTGARTPMQWSDEKNRGFSVAEKTYLPTNTDEECCVSVQKEDTASLLNTVKALIGVRKSSKAFNYSSDLKIDEVRTKEGGYPLVYSRCCENEEYVVVLQPRKEETVLHIPYSKMVFSSNCRIQGEEIRLLGRSFAILKK